MLYAVPTVLYRIYAVGLSKPSPIGSCIRALLHTQSSTCDTQKFCILTNTIPCSCIAGRVGTVVAPFLSSLTTMIGSMMIYVGAACRQMGTAGTELSP